MEYLLRAIEGLLNQIKAIIVSKNMETEAGKKLYQTALTFLGKDASPVDKAPDELGCAESVNAICQVAWGEPAGGGLSTYWLYFALKNHKKFVEVANPIPGDIIVSPTGLGGKNGIKNGHTGIVGDKGKIMSSNSSNGLWEQNYDIWSWRYRYATIGGYPVFFFRRIIG